MFEAVGNIRLISSMIGIAAKCAVEVEALVLSGHEGAVDGNLVQIDSNAVILRIAVEEHAKLEKWVGRVLNAWDHTARGKGSLFYVTMIVLRVLVEDKAAKLVHLNHQNIERCELRMDGHTGN